MTILISTIIAIVVISVAGILIGKWIRKMEEKDVFCERDEEA